MRFLILFLIVIHCRTPVGALPPMRKSLKTSQVVQPASKAFPQGRVHGLSTLASICTNRPGAAKVATALLLLNGSLFRLLDDFVLKNFGAEENTKINRSLARRIGRRFLALGASAFSLFFLEVSPLTAVGAGGAVLLLDRARRSGVKKEQQSYYEGWEIRVDRFMDVLKLHLYSTLAWSGVLHPILPGAQYVPRAMGICLGILAAKDIFFPDKFVEGSTNQTAHLCQSSGYAMAGLSLFVVGLSFSQDQASSLNAMGYACIANLYSIICLSPVDADDDLSEYNFKDDKLARLRVLLTSRVKRGLYYIWLVTNGAIAARLASPGSVHSAEHHPSK